MKENLVEWLDRLPIEKIEKLRNIMEVGELDWADKWDSIGEEVKNEFGKVVFGQNVKDVVIRKVKEADGFPIPVIIAKPT